MVHLPPASLFAEQTEPFLFVWDRNCLLPPTELECDFDYHRNGPDTHALALKRLTALFGTPERARPKPDNTVLLAAEETFALDKTAAEVAAFWGLPLKITHYDDY